MTGIEAFLSILSASGVKHLFGNPGTTELPVNDALANQPKLEYVFGLHEIPVVSMADGFAQASGSISVANVHIGCGLGNAMGMLYNAFVAGSPVLLTAGQQDRRLQLEEPVLAADLVSVARPWTKWAYEIQRVEDFPTATRRAIQTALTPPTGPVFLALPVDVQTEARDSFGLSPARIPDRRTRPPADAVREAAKLLLGAKNPAILAGSRVTESGGIAALVHVAERLGAKVFTECTTIHGRHPFPTEHSLAGDRLAYWSPDLHKQLEGFDVLFVVGMNLLRMYIHHELERPIPEAARIIHLDSNAWEIGKNYAVEVGLFCDPKTGLEELTTALDEQLSPAQKEAAYVRYAKHAQSRQQSLQSLQRKLAEQSSLRPMTPLVMMSAIAKALPKDVAVIDEGITTTGSWLERLGALPDPYGYFGQRGWALGWGLGFALGVKLARPQRPVLALIGDGASLYGIQALWTAAHHRIPVTFVICNNAQYKILKDCAENMPLPQMKEHRYLAMDLVQPEIEFLALAKGFGVEARRISEPEELTQLVGQSLRENRLQLFDVAVARGN
jgi:benzoylformate decarboxylase